MGISAEFNQTFILDNKTSAQNDILATSTRLPVSIGRTGSPEDGIISHHRDLMDWSMLHPESNDSRELLDRPLMGIAIIGGFFLTISLLLVLAIIVFYLKRNTVFVLEKGAHGGLYTPGDQSVVIGQTFPARQLGARYSQIEQRHCRTNYDQTVNDEELEDEDDDSGELMEDVDYEALTPSRQFQHRNNLTGSYMVRRDHFIFANPRNYQHAPNCNYLKQNLRDQFSADTPNYKCPHQNQVSLNSGLLQNQHVCGQFAKDEKIYDPNTIPADRTDADLLPHRTVSSGKMGRPPNQNQNSLTCAPDLCSQSEQIKLHSSGNEGQGHPRQSTVLRASVPADFSSSSFHLPSNVAIQILAKSGEQLTNVIANPEHPFGQHRLHEQPQQRQQQNNTVESDSCIDDSVRVGGL